ncbi:MAG TPA: hypothetical protein VJJ23_03825 [Candidatus Nanoarchaeia archaeon]|nr:hypothetical protein [Candidatus Nanoarchaeia archaeon]
MKRYYLLLILLIFLTGCVTSLDDKVGKERLELQIKDKINALNYCNIDKDCVTHSFGCPFECNSQINKNSDLNEVNGLITLYNGMNKGEVCMYQCVQPEPLKCVQSKCVTQ